MFVVSTRPRPRPSGLKKKGWGISWLQTCRSYGAKNTNVFNEINTFHRTIIIEQQLYCLPPIIVHLSRSSSGVLQMSQRP